MNNNIQNTIDLLLPIFTATEDALNGWSGEGNLQLPVLLGMVGIKLGWDEEKIRQNDPIIRMYVRNHSDWYVTRGAHGGIMKRSDRDKKEAIKVAKEAAKVQIKALVDAKVAEAAKASDSEKKDSE